MRTLQPKPIPLPYALPMLARRRPRSFAEWSALRRWGRLPAQEECVIGYQLREAREAAGISQTAMALRLGCSQQAVSQAERWRSNPTIGFARRWTEALGGNLEVRIN